MFSSLAVCPQQAVSNTYRVREYNPQPSHPAGMSPYGLRVGTGLGEARFGQNLEVTARSPVHDHVHGG